MGKAPDKCPMCGGKTQWKKVDERNKEWLTNDFQRMDQQRLIQLQESGETIKITTG